MKDYMPDITKIIMKNSIIDLPKKKEKIVVTLFNDEVLNKINMFSCMDSKKSEQIVLNQLSKKSRRSFLIEKTIDLHGFTKNIAFSKLVKFFNDCINKEIYRILIITGGSNVRQSVLRESFLEWLNEAFKVYISSYSEANLKNGGAGAFYILLKRKK